jgi:hypothetical protein
MNTNFDELGHEPTLARQVWVAFMEMAISIAKVAKGHFCTQETLHQLRTPLALPTIQHTPIMLSPMFSTLLQIHHLSTMRHS